MWFFENKNAVAVCVYCAIMEMSGFYLLWLDADSTTHTERIIETLRSITSAVISILWLLAAAYIWKRRDDFAKKDAFGFFIGTFGFILLLHTWEPIWHIVDEGSRWTDVFTALEILSCVQLILVAFLIRFSKYKAITKLRWTIAAFLLLMIAGRAIDLLREDFDIGNYIDCVSDILVFTFTLISLFDTDIRNSLDEFNSEDRELHPLLSNRS